MLIKVSQLLSEVALYIRPFGPALNINKSKFVLKKRMIIKETICTDTEKIHVISKFSLPSPVSYGSSLQFVGKINVLCLTTLMWISVHYILDLQIICIWKHCTKLLDLQVCDELVYK